MSEQTPFQEKPDWKGKLSTLSGRLTSLFKRRQNTDGDELPGSPEVTTRTSALVQLSSLFKKKPKDNTVFLDTAPEPGPSDGPTNLATNFTTNFKMNLATERTLTAAIAQTWREKVAPKFTGFAKKADGPTPIAGAFSAVGGAVVARPALNEKTLNWLAVVVSILLVTYIGADLSALLIDQFIPEPAAVRGAGSSMGGLRMRSMQEYDIVISRNLFNSRGLIPGDDLPATPTDNNNVPVKTALPFNLVGTLVLKNELRSVATIEDTSEQRVYPVRVDDEIPNRARILSIEPFRVIFVNPSNGRREFVEIPEDASAAPRFTLNAPNAPAASVEKVGETNFNVAKTEIQASLANWEKVLTEARAVPHTENGQPAGFMLLQIVPGSIYSKLGLQNRDILRGVNGDPVNDVTKAMKLLELLQTSNSIELQITRQGKTSNFTYNIK